MTVVDNHNRSLIRTRAANSLSPNLNRIRIRVVSNHSLNRNHSPNLNLRIRKAADI